MPISVKTKISIPILPLSLLSHSWGQKETENQNSSRPNIIYIMSDDRTIKAFDIYETRLAELNPTPNLDKIANEGMIFENAFVSNSICTPDRAVIISGQNSQLNGVLDLNGL
mgnify:CR=1 FL=1